MKRNIIAAILLVSAIAFSCTTKEEPSKELLNDASVVYNPTVTIKPFVFDGPATKTTLTIGENGANFTFRDGDALGVYPYATPNGGEYGTQVAFTVKSSDASSCTFNGGGFGLKSGQLYAVYYPYSTEGNLDEVTDDNLKDIIENFPVNYTGQRQTSKDGVTFDISAADFLVDNSVTPFDNVCEFEMEHIGALMVLDVTFPHAGNYTNISLTSDGTLFTTEGTINLTAGTEIAPDVSGATVTLALGEEGGNGLAIDADQQVRFCMMVAPVDLSNATVTLSATTSTGTVLSKELPQASRAVVAGNAYRYLCNLNPAAVDSEPTNLSEWGTANSYIVDTENLNTGGYYFNATVAGNASPLADLATTYGLNSSNTYPASALTDCIISGTWAKVMLNQNNCITDVNYADGKISFKATGVKGNAKITLVNGADDNDNYVWTWLIWCTDKPAKITVGSYQAMDRNLGATTNGTTDSDPEAMYGLYYQFGNPIGFTSAEYSNADKGGYRMYDALARMPNKPFVDYNSNGAYRWFNPYISTYSDWVFGRLWGGFSSAIYPTYTTAKQGKSLYDPCPVGYQVPPYDFFNQISLTSGDSYGRYWTGDGDATLFFPFNGGKWKANSDGVGVDGYAEAPEVYLQYWTAWHETGWHAWFFTNADTPNGSIKEDKPLTRGMGVRCVKW